MSSYEDIIRGHRLTAERDPCRRSVAQRPVEVETDGRSGRALVPVLVFLGMVVSVISSLGAPLIPSIAVDYRVSIGGAPAELRLAADRSRIAGGRARPDALGHDGGPRSPAGGPFPRRRRGAVHHSVGRGWSRLPADRF